MIERLEERTWDARPLPYRATVFLRTEVDPLQGRPCDAPVAPPATREDCLERMSALAGGALGVIELMERSFAKEADAVVWCNIMTEAEPHATGAWFVAYSRGGRKSTITRETGLSLGASDAATAPAEDPLGEVLATAGLRSADVPQRSAALLDPRQIA